MIYRVIFTGSIKALPYRNNKRGRVLLEKVKIYSSFSKKASLSALIHKPIDEGARIQFIHSGEVMFKNTRRFPNPTCGH